MLKARVCSWNGGRTGDHCSCDAYTSSIYTISVSSISRYGVRPDYLEECSSTLAAAYSGEETEEMSLRGTQNLLEASVPSQPLLMCCVFVCLYACLLVSLLYGFGLLDAESMVKEAERWKQVPAQRKCVEEAIQLSRIIYPGSVLTSTYKTTGCASEALRHVVYVEHVIICITITHSRRGDLSITLTSPAGTVSQLLAHR
ncbi:hypothetical protein XENOCAPTIV_004692 [Xenoophorus captivus]|uniref:P/Homo B domain-containing protein n=1 Tax=Xenoophorus captivus TaxID=1517983 RepID=A0ABV0QYI6_9TELE